MVCTVDVKCSYIIQPYHAGCFDSVVLDSSQLPSIGLYTLIITHILVSDMVVKVDTGSILSLAPFILWLSMEQYERSVEMCADV